MAKQKANYLAEVLGSILTSGVNEDQETYEKKLDAIAVNYDKVNGKKGKKPTVEERRKRVQQNFYGTTINFLYQILSMVTDNNIRLQKNELVLNEIAKKLGIDTEEIKTADEKAMEMVEKYYRERKAKLNENKE